MSNRATVSLYHDTRRPLDNGKFTVYVRVNFKVGDNWKQKYYSTGISMDEKSWERVKSEKVRGEQLRKAVKLIRTKEKEANDIIDKEPLIRPDKFDALYTGKSSTSAMITPLFDELIASMNKAGRISSASLYKGSKDALIAFGGEGLTLDMIDKDWLMGFESAMRQKELSTTTIAIYLRNLRAVFNIAKERKIISSDIYPFGRKRYVIPTAVGVKKALSEDDKNKLIAYKPTIKAQRRALEDWTFSYYCNGMNFADMAVITKDSIRGDLLTFKRTKTTRTKRETQPLIVVLLREPLEILRRRNDDPYLFGIIQKDDSPKQRKAKIHQWIKTTNKHLKAICSDLGIERVTTYTARHTAATVLMRAGTKLVDIRDALGHTSVTTTENYLASLNLDERRQLAERL